MKLELTLNYLVATTEPNQSWRAAYLAAGNVELDSITKKSIGFIRENVDRSSRISLQS